MLLPLCHGLLLLLLCSFFLPSFALEIGFPRCSCFAENFWSIEGILQWQKMMQGNIWAIPNPQGQPETLILLLQLQTQSFTPTAEPNSYHISTSTPIFKNLRVLLADDDAVNRAVTRKLLEKLGCHVTSVSSGMQCLSSITTFGTPPFQLIVLDLHMNKMDGFEVAGKIRKTNSGSWPAIIALTASAEDGIWERCLQSGMNGLIRKPVMLQTLRDELYSVLQNA